jgi:hypothetical protein
MYNASSQDTLSNKIQIQAGAEIIPGLTLGWKSKDYEIYPYHSDEDGTIMNSFFAGGIYSEFYIRKILLSAGVLISSEKLLATVPIGFGGQFYGSHPFYDLDYTGKYLEFPLTVGLVLNKNAGNKKTFLTIGTIISFLYYERIRKFNSDEVYYGSNKEHYNFNMDSETKNINYNRTCLLFSLGRETPFIKNSKIYFKRALTFITTPLDIKRNTSEIFTSSRLGVELGFSYRLK